MLTVHVRLERARFEDEGLADADSRLSRNCLTAHHVEELLQRDPRLWAFSVQGKYLQTHRVARNQARTLGSLLAAVYIVFSNSTPRMWDGDNSLLAPRVARIYHPKNTRTHAHTRVSVSRTCKHQQRTSR